MRSISAALAAAARQASRDPVITAAVRNDVECVRRLDYTSLNTTSNTVAKHDVAVSDDGTVHRVRMSAGAVKYNRVLAADTGTPANFDSWSDLATGQGSQVAVAARGAYVLVVYTNAAGTNIRYRESTDSGATFSADALFQTFGAGLADIACAYKDSAGECAVFAVTTIGGQTKACKRVAGVIGGVLTDPTAQSAVSGIAATFAFQWELLITGTEVTTLKPTAWSQRLIDSSDTWETPFPQFQGDSGLTTFGAPFLTFLDTWRLNVTELPLYTGGVTRAWRSYLHPAETWNRTAFLLRTQLPTDHSLSVGLAIAANATAGYAYESSTDRVQRAPTALVSLDIAADIQALEIHESTLDTHGWIDLVNPDDPSSKRYALPPPAPIKLGNMVRIGFGYHTDAVPPAGIAANHVYAQAAGDDAVARVPIGSTDWSGMRDTTAASFMKLRHYSDALFRVQLKGSDEYGNDAVGQLQRSDDAGVSWINIGPAPFLGSAGDWWGCKDYDVAADGKLYALYGTDDALSSNQDAAGIDVYRVLAPLSSATFELIYEDNERTFGSALSIPLSLSCHPSNADVVAVSYDAASGNCRVATTTNATAAVPAFTKRVSNHNILFRIAIQDSGALVGLADNGGDIYRSTDDGLNFTAVQAIANSVRGTVFQGRGAPGSATQFVAGANGSTADIDLWRSKDNGATWVNLIRTTAPGGLVSAICYHAAGDAIYIATSASGSTTKVYKLTSASTVGALSGTETDITGDLDGVAGMGNDTSGITVAPAVTGGADETSQIQDLWITAIEHRRDMRGGRAVLRLYVEGALRRLRRCLQRASVSHSADDYRQVLSTIMSRAGVSLSVTNASSRSDTVIPRVTIDPDTSAHAAMRAMLAFLADQIFMGASSTAHMKELVSGEAADYSLANEYPDDPSEHPIDALRLRSAPPPTSEVTVATLTAALAYLSGTAVDHESAEHGLAPLTRIRDLSSDAISEADATADTHIVQRRFERDDGAITCPPIVALELLDVLEFDDPYTADTTLTRRVSAITWRYQRRRSTALYEQEIALAPAHDQDDGTGGIE